MQTKQLKVTIDEKNTPFTKKDGTYDKEAMLKHNSKTAGICYESDLSVLENEPEKRTLIRIGNTLAPEHSTPYEHSTVSLKLENITKALAVLLNNERQCATTERSFRYTTVEGDRDPNISPREYDLYKKWINILIIKYKKTYGTRLDSKKIEKAAQDDARYMITVFASTRMTHSIPWPQLNRIASFMLKLMEKPNKSQFEQRLILDCQELIRQLEGLNLLDDRAMLNRKHRELSLFADREVKEHFGDSYATSYEGSWVQFAQAHRTRPIKYSVQVLNSFNFYPPILDDEPVLIDEWFNDLHSVRGVTPQGQSLLINEIGSYDDFILKTKERFCTHAGTEVTLQTWDTAVKYREWLNTDGHPLAEDIEKYSRGSRCLSGTYDCAKSCGFKEGIELVKRKI